MLAGFRRLANRLGVTRRRKIGIRLMDWWHKMIFPMRRVWVAAVARIKSRKNGRGLLKLRNDVQTCGYQDVQVMWEMLRRTESELTAHTTTTKRKQRPLWRVFVWSNNRSPSSPK